jgi:hypothetical protein
MLAHPSLTFEDVIGWDHDLLRGIEGLNVDQSKMELAVRVRSDLRSGYGVRADVGFYRLVCTNGLVSTVLNMGQWRANHANFSGASLYEFASAQSAAIEARPTAPMSLLDDVITTLERIDEEREYIERLPRLVQQPAKMIARESSGGKGLALVEGLKSLRDSGDTFSKLDLVNAQTNVAHSARSQWSVYNQTDTVVSALSDLVELAAVKHDLQAF